MTSKKFNLYFLHVIEGAQRIMNANLDQFELFMENASAQVH